MKVQVLGETRDHGRPSNKVSLRHYVEQGEGVMEIAALGVHVEKMVGDEGGGGAGAGAGEDEAGVELLGFVEFGSSGVGLDELGQECGLRQHANSGRSPAVIIAFSLSMHEEL